MAETRSMVSGAKGGTGSFSFVLVPLARPSLLAAVPRNPFTVRDITTKRPGVPVEADPYTRLPLGRYALVELDPADEGGTWNPTSVTCDGVTGTSPVVTVELTADKPRALCEFTDTFTPDPRPTPTPGPSHSPTPAASPTHTAAPVPADRADLPHTGTDAARLAGPAGLGLAFGVVLLAVASRRRHRTSG